MHYGTLHLNQRFIFKFTLWKFAANIAEEKTLQLNTAFGQMFEQGFEQIYYVLPRIWFKLR